MMVTGVPPSDWAYMPTLVLSELTLSVTVILMVWVLVLMSSPSFALFSIWT